MKLNISKNKGILFNQTLPVTYRQKVECCLTLENHGCLIQSEGWYSIDASWSYDQITNALRDWFPKPFAYIDSRRRMDKPSRFPDWLVVNCSGLKFSIVEAGFPTGETLQAFKGRSKVGLNESHLWLGKYFSRQMFQNTTNLSLFCK